MNILHKDAFERSLVQQRPQGQRYLKRVLLHTRVIYEDKYCRMHLIWIRLPTDNKSVLQLVASPVAISN